MFHQNTDLQTAVREMNECPVCYEELNTFVQCANEHKVCTLCFPRLHSCPLCRGQIVLFTDGRGNRIFCENYEFGCRATGDHECLVELFKHCTTEEPSLLRTIIVSLLYLREDEVIQLFDFDVAALIECVERLKRSWIVHRNLWLRFLPNRLLRNILIDLINGI